MSITVIKYSGRRERARGGGSKLRTVYWVLFLAIVDFHSFNDGPIDSKYEPF